jgi:hydroxypyruvate isomerase
MTSKTNTASQTGTLEQQESQGLPLGVAARHFTGIPIAEALAQIARAGFQFMDNFDWRNVGLFEDYKVAMRRHDLRAGVLVVNKVPDVNALGCSLVDVREREGFLHEMRACIAAAQCVQCSKLEILSGNTMPDIPVEDQMLSAIDTLRASVPLLEENRTTAVIEMLKSAVDHPGYFLNSTRRAYDIIDAVGGQSTR